MASNDLLLQICNALLYIEFVDMFPSLNFLNTFPNNGKNNCCSGRSAIGSGYLLVGHCPLEHSLMFLFRFLKKYKKTPHTSYDTKKYLFVTHYIKIVKKLNYYCKYKKLCHSAKRNV